MPLGSHLFGPATPGLSSLQRELELRKRCYQEKILRGLYAKHPGFDSGWTDQDAEKYGGRSASKQYDKMPDGQGPTLCDILRYRKPDQPSCDKVDQYPIIPKSPDDSIFSRLARLEIVARQPERQQEIFGWVTPAKNDLVAQEVFALHRASYWRLPPPNSVPKAGTFAESVEKVQDLQETADFHANYLLRLLYLFGDTPAHLRTHRAAWRRIGHFDRDINFSAQAERIIRNDLLAFKYWLDEPFFAEVESGVNKSEMTFWSENHQILFATAEYLAGQLWPEAIFRVGNHFRKEGADRTRPTDLLGRQRMDRAKPRILRWLNDRLRFGFSEWNSPGYYVEDFTALFNLADFCLDEEIQIRACMVLDLLIFDLARFTHRGSFGVTAGRCYFEHKNCGYEQSVGDLIEILFGTRGGMIVEDSSTAAGAFAASRRYQTPDVLIAIGHDKPENFIDRSRVSINFDEAASYGIGFESDDDVLFWWSRAAFFTKQVIESTHSVAKKYHLLNTSPFDNLGATKKLATVLHVAGYAELTAAVFSDPPLIALADNPFSDKEADAADLASIVTEGSALTRANLYTYRSRNAMLSSVQNFRSSQLNFQGQYCQATLSSGATVWTSYPNGGDALSLFKDQHHDWPSHDGPNWWTGSATTPRVIQVKNAAIIAYKPKEIQSLLFGHRTHAWFPKAAFDEGSVVQSGGNTNIDSGLWTFGKVGDGYVALFSAQTPSWTTSGPWSDKELIAEGTRNFFILQVGSAAEFGNYEQFVDKVAQARIHVRGLSVVTMAEAVGGIGGAAAGASKGYDIAGPLGAVVGGAIGALWGSKKGAEDFECSYDIPGGDRLELHYDHNQVRYAGKELTDDRYPRFENKYIKCDRVYWGQCFYTIRHGNHSLTHDFRTIQNLGTPQSVVRSLESAKDEYDCNSGPRPFYIVAHNPNSIQQVKDALAAGANAIEPDINVYEGRQDALCVSEAGILDADQGGGADAPSLERYLNELHEVARIYPQLSLVVFDCKPKAATPDHGAILLREIRRRLTFDIPLNVIISVSSLGETGMFERIQNVLGPREGLMVDEENDPVAVASFFTRARVENCCYGNGSFMQNPVLSPNLRPSIEHACGMRAGQGSFKFIYEWTNNDDERMREFIRTGVDGIITDDASMLKDICQEDEFQPLIRLATRTDNPLDPPNANYELQVHTGDVHMGGTDVNVTFALAGSKGTISKTVDTSLDGRMERGDWNYVTIQSPDIGKLISVAVQRDNDGNAPDWYLDRIMVQSARYRVSKVAVFNRWIDSSALFTQPLI